jgi:hypothetical protein
MLALPGTRQKMINQAFKKRRNKKETLLSQNCSSIEIYISTMNEVNSYKYNHQNQTQDDVNKASND